MKRYIRTGLLLLVASVLPAVASAQTLPSSVKADANPAVRASQEQAYDVVNRYEELLNKGDTQGIVDLYAPDGVAEWNDKPTAVTREQKIQQYSDLFKIAKFTTKFSYDAVYVDGDIAIVRTHHHVGAKVLENGKEVLDKNREIFVLRRQADGWKILIYSFNTNPIQGVE